MADGIGMIEGPLDLLLPKVEPPVFVQRKKAIQPVFAVSIYSPSKIKEKGFALTELLSIHGALTTSRVFSGCPSTPPSDALPGRAGGEICPSVYLHEALE
jgi:hypothetical protein